MGRMRVMIREGRRWHAEEVHGTIQRGIHCPWDRGQLGWGSCLPAPGRGESPPEKAKLGIGDVMEGFKRQRVKVKKKAWGEVWVMHGGLDLTAQRKAKDEAKDTNCCSQFPLKQP